MSGGNEVRPGLKYTKEHEWLKVEGHNARIGITDHAQHALTDVVFVELPKKGKKVKTGETLGVVESVKSVSDIFSPVAGEVVETNGPLEDDPGLINQKPYDDGWYVVIKMNDPKEADKLMTGDQYKASLQSH
ncbi:MAG: glycine cleavage system protein GcvH [Euryarchaeota archaeon]|nr:glycine cleavage system protein GcvH [Euryarchaeota archaeon]